VFVFRVPIGKKAIDLGRACFFGFFLMIPPDDLPGLVRYKNMNITIEICYFNSCLGLILGAIACDTSPDDHVRMIRPLWIY